jgi:hypothetical protein
VTYGAGRHPNRFLVECPACQFRRVILPGGVLVCLLCDRSYSKDNTLAGPGNAPTAEEPPITNGPFWDPPKLKG